MRLRFGDGRALWFAAAAVRRPSVLERGRARLLRPWRGAEPPLDDDDDGDDGAPRDGEDTEERRYRLAGVARDASELPREQRDLYERLRSLTAASLFERRDVGGTFVAEVAPGGGGGDDPGGGGALVTFRRLKTPALTFADVAGAEAAKGALGAFVLFLREARHLLGTSSSAPPQHA